jgi:hypothetical protein
MKQSTRLKLEAATCSLPREVLGSHLTTMRERMSRNQGEIMALHQEALVAAAAALPLGLDPDLDLDILPHQTLKSLLTVAPAVAQDILVEEAALAP